MPHHVQRVRTRVSNYARRRGGVKFEVHRGETFRDAEGFPLICVKITRVG
jgi:hypothetical protein